MGGGTVTTSSIYGVYSNWWLFNGDSVGRMGSVNSLMPPAASHSAATLL